MEIVLYSTAMQTVPLLLIALFLDKGRAKDDQISPRSQRLSSILDRVFAVLGFVAFMISLLVVAGAVEVSPITAAVVIAALAGSIGLLFAQIWSRFDRTW